MSDLIFLSECLKRIEQKEKKGYQALVGTDSKAGCFKYFQDEQEATKWAEAVRETLKEHIKGELKIFITPIELHKCNTSWCSDLIPKDELYCLSCDELLFDAQIENNMENEYD